ncbi:MAG: M81 family metallopeptidase [Gammaproteobacteria bacterium]|nr:M81 family metallopeptidase [Gammaproteobacteria bacterium]
MARIAVGGWQHETNTFAPIRADFAAFEEPNDWPGLCRGAAMFDGVDGVHLPITGAIEALRSCGHELVPLLWCSATPCAHVTEDAFERISAMLLEDITAAGPLDGIYLDLHGAMVCEHYEDGEGEFLRRVRDLVGPDLPVAVSLDLHANLTAAMVEHASIVDLYRTYPHVDMGETGSRTAGHLDRLLAGGEHWAKALRRTDFLIPLNWQCTLVDPAKSLYGRIPELIRDGVQAVGFGCGFPLADIAECGPAVVAYASDQTMADQAADALIGAVIDAETDFVGRLYDPAEAVTEALRASSGARGPVILADTQDNPGGGGPGDTVGMLRSLIEGKAAGALFGLVCDREVASQAHAAGIGATFDAALGERSGLTGHWPLTANFRVVALGDGRFTATGAMYRGAHMQLGLMALLEVSGVRVAVSSRAAQVADQSMFRHLGIDPARERIIALKSSVHFRADFQEMASAVLVVTAPGPVIADPAQLYFHNLRPGLRAGTTQLS